MCLETVNDRTKWAIDYIIKRDHLSNVKIAEKMGFSPGAINSYRTKQTTPPIEFVLKFCELFIFSLLWFVDGWGYPFMGAKDTHPESLGPNPIPTVPDWPGLFGPDADKPFIPVHERFPEYFRDKNESPVGEQPAIKISEELTLAAKVLESGSDYATALRHNIRAFARSIQAEERIAQVERNQLDFERKMQSRMEGLERTIKRLEVENKQLKGCAGDSPPFSLSPANCAHTGTGEPEK